MMTETAKTGPTGSKSAVTHQLPRFGLGSVQFGLPYGMLEGPRQVPRANIRPLLECAWHNGIDLIDTAPAYGMSEAVIGAESPDETDFFVVTKTQRIGAERVTAADINTIIKRIHTSLHNLGRTKLNALLVHEGDDLLVPGGAALFSALEELRDDGLIGKLGVSVYHPDQLEKILDRYALNIVQLPLNPIDQRFAQTGLIERLHNGGIEVHVRSVFLQGFMLNRPAEIPPALEAVLSLAERFRAEAARGGLSPAAASLLLAVRQPGVSRIIVGIHSIDDLEENISTVRQLYAFDGEFDYEPYAVSDHNIVDPRRWSAWPQVSEGNQSHA